jgi:hypothetical protein
MFKLHSPYQEEADPDEGSDLGGAPGAEGEGEAPAPSYFVGDLDEDTVVNRLKYAGELPDRLSALESRMGQQVSPLSQRLDELQRAMGTQAAFDPKFDKISAVLREYDPALAEKFLPALIEDLKGSLRINALDQSALEPFINPMLEAASGRQAQAATTAMLDIVGIHPQELVAKDQQGNVLDPQTELQKDFYSWWGLQDAATQAALKSYDMGLVQSLNRFKQWRAERIKEKGGAAGVLSSRLATGRQVSSGQRQARPGELKTEEDGFNSVFQKR